MALSYLYMTSCEIHSFSVLGDLAVSLNLNPLYLMLPAAVIMIIILMLIMMLMIMLINHLMMLLMLMILFLR